MRVNFNGCFQIQTKLAAFFYACELAAYVQNWLYLLERSTKHSVDGATIQVAIFRFDVAIAPTISQ